ncbi:FG-GAP-like repeat-containing protein, partial [Flavobacteriaceae bacterium]|nr:FG-GAP-like repeat-containing protein [Flavobacteriaceae bacterium]
MYFGWGDVVRGFADNTIEGNIIYNNSGSGITVGRDSNIIKKNFIINNTGSGINISGTYIYEGLTIENNVISGNLGYGLDLTSNTNSVIRYNSILNSGGDSGNPSVGIPNSYITSNNNAITYNTIDASKNNAIELRYGPNTFNNNNFIKTKGNYILKLLTDNDSDINAENNYWGTSTESEIQVAIYDYSDDFELGAVDYTPFSTALNTTAPISPPSNVTKSVSGSDVVLNWSANGESDIAGYKLYYGTPTGYSYVTTVDLENVTTYTVTGGDIATEYTITAYDSSLDGTDDMVDGNESWFSVANQVNVTLSSSATSISEPTNSATLTATLDNTSSADVVVNLTYSGTATNATDYSGANSVTISAGSLTGTIAITAIDDTDVELTETIIIDMGDVSGGAENGTQQVTINLTDNDLPSVSSIAVDKTDIDENSGVAVITATISAVQSKDVTIPLTISGTANLNDYSTAFASNIVNTVAGGNDQGNALNQFHSPEHLHVDSENNIYVSDRENHRVVKWTQNATEGIVVAGGNGAGSDLNQLSNPAGIYVDSSGNVYIADYYNHRVTKWVPGAIEGILVAGGNGSGSDLNQINGPAGIDIDSSGNLYVADTENHRVMKWEPDATEGTIVAGGNTNGSELHMLNYAQDISVDDSGNIYVADFNNSRVMKWAPNAVQGVNVLGYVYRPISIELDSQNNIYVSKFYRHTVDKYTLSGSTYSESTIFGTYNSNGSSLNQLSNPRGLHIDSTGNIYVSDQENHRIQKFQVNPEIKIASGDTTGTVTFTGIDDSTDEAGETIIVTPSTSPTNATSSISTASTITITDDDDSPSVTFAFSADSIEENSSTDVTLTATLSEASGQDVFIPYTVSGTATITDEYTINASPITISAGATTGTVTISTNGKDDSTVEIIETIILTFGTLVNASTETTDVTLNLISDDNPNVSGLDYSKTEFAEHESFTLTATLDAAHSKESIIPLTVTGTAELDTDYSVSFETKGKAGVFHGGNGNGNGDNQLKQPEGLALDSDGNLYIADYQNSRIQKVAKSNGEVNTIIDTSPVNPTDIHVDSSGNILVSMSGGGVLKYNSEGVFVDTVSTGMSGISAMHVDNNGDIYTVSNSNGKVWKATSSNSTASILFEDNDVNGFRNSIAVDSDGNVYVSGQNMMVRQWVKSTGETRYLDGEDSNGDAYAGVGSGARAITINSLGNILIASDGGHSGKDENGLIPSSPATIWEYSLENGRINGESKMFTQDLTIQNYYMGISSVIEDSNSNLYLAIGKDASQSGSDFSDDNVKKDRVLFIRNQPSIVIPAGETTGLITFTGIEDDSYTLEDDETIIITTSESINATNTFTDSKTVTLLNNSITVTKKDDPFIGLSKGSVSWGDFDRDGDKDVAIMGQSNTEGAITAIYENKNGEFVNTNQNFAKLYDGDLSWVDINKDGYLDLIVSGINNQIPQTKVYLSKEKATYFEPTEDYGLPQLFSTTMDWGDLDNDGDIDLAISGIDADNNYVFDIYYRENGKQNFIKENNYSGSGFSNGDLLIADLDLDGDNDIIFSGENSNGNTVGGFTRNTIFKGARSINSNSLKNSSIGVYYEPNMKTLVISHIGENSSGNADSSSSSAMGIPLALKNGDISYADYNNDGYIDYVVSGEDDNGNSITKLYNGDWPSQAAEPTFSESSVELEGLRESTVNWVDYDMDGDLDLFLTGINSDGAQSILYETEIRNKKNKSPEKITGLEVEDLGYGKVKFKWDEPSDDYSSGGLGYVLRLGTTAGGSELSNTLSNLESGERLISESPAIFNNYFETQLEPGTYYYSVQAVDSGLKGGLFSEESSYTLTYEWKELNQGGIVDRTISAKENPILKLGDLDNDNDLDLIYGSLTSGSPTVLKFDGFRLVSENQNILNGASTITDAEIGDVNGDGTTDILLNNFTSNGSNNLKIYLSDNSGGFTSVNLDSGLYKAKGRILDLNNDGQSEITIVGLTSDNSSGIPKFYVFEYDKNANSFSDKIDLSSQIASLKSSSFDLGDVDNDQDIDFIISGFDESQGL